VGADVAGLGAAGEAAAAVAALELAAQPARHGAAAPTDPQRRPERVLDQHHQPAVAGQPPGGLRGDAAGVLDPRGRIFRSGHGGDCVDHTVVLDKTGTITKGQPALTDVMATGSLDEAALLRLAASAERSSEHPLGEAIVRGATEHTPSSTTIV
jgi:hypothetical protein